jgi:LysR family glycine cleavage system transcriptional activator
MPRLHQFAATGSRIELHIVSSIEPVSFVDRSADVAIRVGRLPGRSYAPGAPRIELEMVTNWVDVTAEELFPDRLVPVCSPHLFARRRAPARHGDLLDFPLIHTATRRHAWPDWLRAHGVKDGRAEGNLEFGHFFMALEAARRVQGVALVPQIVLTHYPAAHELTAPFPPDVASAGEYYLLTPQSRRGDAPIEAFRAWIMVEARLTATHLLPSSYRPGPLSVTAAGGQRRSHG